MEPDSIRNIYNSIIHPHSVQWSIDVSTLLHYLKSYVELDKKEPLDDISYYSVNDIVQGNNLELYKVILDDNMKKKWLIINRK